MGQGVIKVREELHNKILKMRRVELIVMQPLFDRLWTDEPDSKIKESISKAIMEGDRKTLTKWMKEHESLELGELSVRQLQAIAKRYCIKNYSRMSKVDLIRAINTEETLYEQK